MDPDPTEQALADYKAAAETTTEPETDLNDMPKRSPEEQKESLDFLRAHGVEVSSPEQMKAEVQRRKEMQSLSLETAGTCSFSYVYIPADEHEPVEERSAVVYSDERGNGDQLPALLSNAFTTGLVDEQSLKHSNLQQLSQNDKSLLDRVTPASLAQQGGSTESFRLSDTVYMYLDEVGALKRLPPNSRASAMASRCGYGDGVTFCGDMFVGRMSVANSGGRNADFTLVDMAPDAEWAKSSALENLKRQSEQDRPGGMSAEELATQGGEGDGYTWTQDSSDLEVTVPLPEGTRGKEGRR